MEFIVLFISIGTSLWVLIDAKSIGIKKGQIQGIADMGPWGWFSGCLLLWIIVFPLYLEKRNAFKKVNGRIVGNEQITRYAGWVIIGSVVILIVLSVFPITKTAPSCENNEVKKTVISIFMKEAKIQIRHNSEITKRMKISDTEWESNWGKIAPQMAARVENIRIKEFNKTVGSYLCAADIYYDSREKKHSLPITYSSELAVDKKGQFYVEVYGIHY